MKRFESVEVTYDVGPGKCSTPWIWKTSRAYRLKRRATFKCTAIETATLRPRILTKVSSNSFNLSTPSCQIYESVFLLPLGGTLKVIPVFHSLQKHMDSGKHLMRLERETAYDSIKRKWVEI